MHLLQAVCSQQILWRLALNAKGSMEIDEAEQMWEEAGVTYVMVLYPRLNWCVGYLKARYEVQRLTEIVGQESGVASFELPSESLTDYVKEVHRLKLEPG